MPVSMNKLCFLSCSNIYLIRMYRSEVTLQKLSTLLYIISLFLSVQYVINATAELEPGFFSLFTEWCS